MLPVSSNTTNSSQPLNPAAPLASTIDAGFKVVKVTQSALAPDQAPSSDKPQLPSTQEVLKLFSNYSSDASASSAPDSQSPVGVLTSRAERRKKRTPPSNTPAPQLALAAKETVIPTPEAIAELVLDPALDQAQAEGELPQTSEAPENSVSAVHQRHRRAAATADEPYGSKGTTFISSSRDTVPTPRGLSGVIQCLATEVKVLKAEIKDLHEHAAKWGDPITKLKFETKAPPEKYLTEFKKTVENATTLPDPGFYTRFGVGAISDLDKVTTAELEQCTFEQMDKLGSNNTISLAQSIDIDNVPNGTLVSLETAKEKELALKAKFDGRVQTKLGTTKDVFNDMRASWLTNVGWRNVTTYKELMAYLNENQGDQFYSELKETLQQAYKAYDPHIKVSHDIDEVELIDGDSWLENMSKLPGYYNDKLTRMPFDEFILYCILTGATLGTLFALIYLSCSACCALGTKEATIRQEMIADNYKQKLKALDGMSQDIRAIKHRLDGMEASAAAPAAPAAPAAAVAAAAAPALANPFPDITDESPENKPALRAFIRALVRPNPQKPNELTDGEVERVLLSLRQLAHRTDNENQAAAAKSTEVPDPIEPGEQDSLLGAAADDVVRKKTTTKVKVKEKAKEKAIDKR